MGILGILRRERDRDRCDLYECRNCGTNVTPETDECPTCGSTEICCFSF